MAKRGAAGSVQLFPGSSNLQFHNPRFHTTVNGAVDTQAEILENLRLLDAEVATNAILNAGGRADDVRCYSGTRTEVIAKIEHWMTVGHREHSGIFWLSGPAGAGKSAIVQTLAERCIERGAPMANFFFFRADGSRNQSRRVVATLLHQLLEQLPDLIPLVSEVMSQNRLIFKKMLRTQFTKLIDGPVRALRQATPTAQPIILLLDGLDECDSRPELDTTTKAEQTSLLQALHELISNDTSQFIVLVASREESHIQMAFNRIGRNATSIYLDGTYEPHRDIRHYVKSELANIRLTHPLARYLAASWPAKSVVDAIVEKSSGQFIYAATVIRFIAGSPQSPAITIEVVQSVRPVHKHSPFSEIDAIYTFILSRAEHWQSASEIIAVHAMHSETRHFMSPFPFVSLGYSQHETASYFSDLTSLLQAEISDDDMNLTFYHASFNDFIYNPKRAGVFHIDLTSYANSLAPRLISGISDYHTYEVAMGALKRVSQTSRSLTHALTRLPAKPPAVEWQNEILDVKTHFFKPVRNLYATHDPDLFRELFDHMQQQDWIPDMIHLSDSLSLYRIVSVPNPEPEPEPEPQNLPKPKRQHWFRSIFC